MRQIRTGIAVLALTALGLAPAPSAEVRPIDHWLVTDVLASDTAGTPLATDLLEAPGVRGVLPDRGLPAAGVTWHLVRQDGRGLVSLDSLRPEAGPGDVVYAHSYVRLPADRTLRLSWGGTACTRGRAWLNGREISRSEMSARFGRGWNTLLLKLVAGDCPFGFEATISSEEPRRLDGLRIQASKPYGNVRTGPQPWVIPADTARIAAERRWRDDRLYAGVVIGLTAWGAAPVADIGLELTGGVDGEATAPWLTPANPVEVPIPVGLGEAERLLRRESIELRLRWDEQETEHTLRVAGEVPAASNRIALDGWTVRPAGAPGSESGLARLPTAEGWMMEGEWEVPEALAGRTLVLLTEGAPARYRLNHSPADDGDGEITLCAPCDEGMNLELAARSSGAWTTMPVVRVAESGGA